MKDRTGLLPKINQRTCVGCRQISDKGTLIRIARKDGQVKLDLTGKMPGRGAYIHKSETCLKIALKKNGLSRTLKCKVPREIYELLDGEINDPS
jgi:predicted RNA-binding protein YlxR (DUF448 family)